PAREIREVEPGRHSPEAEIAAPVEPRTGGVFDVRLVAAGADTPLETDPNAVAQLVGGRLSQQGARFQTPAAALRDGELVATLRALRPPEAPEGGACEVDGAPEYRA